MKSLNTPTIQDTPLEIISISVGESVSGRPSGAKGMGTLVVCPGVPATLKAIAHATRAMVYDLPATPAKILRVLAGQQTVLVLFDLFETCG